jgi:DAK2 domain fusion protein YloV
MTTVAQPPLPAWEGSHFLQALRAAERWLDQQVPLINALNVFPVPDGDTGTNMHLTLAAAVRNVPENLSCATVAARVYEEALRGSRGNSGVILSQILRGIAQGLAGQPRCGPAELAAALAQGSATAYRASPSPREGTILTVSRATGEAAQAALAAPDATLLSVLEAAVAGARVAVDRTPEQLEVLRNAGVVDAGGEGYFVILEGMLRWSRGESLEFEQPADAPVAANVAAAFEDAGHEGYGFCTNVLVRGEEMPFEAIRDHITAVGESVVVVGDEALIRVHVHTERPGDILNFLGEQGTLLKIEIANMDMQREELREARAEAGRPAAVPPAVRFRRAAAAAGFATVAVAPGEGFSELFLSLNADAVVTGGQTMNPSTQDILEAIEGVAAEQVVVLPNNGNIIGAAEQATQLSPKQVLVVPTKTVPQGIAALLGRNLQLPFEQNVEAMGRASRAVLTAEITTAVRDATVNGVDVRAGQTIGLVDDVLVTAGDARDAVIDATLERMALDERELLTIYYGQHVAEPDAQALVERIGAQYPDHSIELRFGGQPFYDFIMSAE